MTIRTWVRRLFDRKPRRAPEGSHKAPARCRPAIEALEARLAPAVLTVNTWQDDSNQDHYLSLREAIETVDLGNMSNLDSAQVSQISGTLGKNDTIQFASSLAGAENAGQPQPELYFVSDPNSSAPQPAQT